MGEAFEKIKKNRTQVAILEIAVCSLAGGILAAGAVLLALKLAGVPLAAWWYGLVGLGGALIGFAVSAPLVWFNGKKLAKKLDNEYALAERTQTALAFQGADGAVVERQREDAEEKLRTLPDRRRRISQVWHYAALCLLAPAIFVTALALPRRGTASADPGSRPFAVTEFQLLSVRELIGNVQSAGLKAPYGENAAARLEELYAALPAAETVGEMEELVYTAIEGVNTELRAGSTYRAWSLRLGEASETELVRALRRSVILFESPTFLNYEDVQTFHSEIFGRVNSTVNLELTRIYTQYGAEEEGFAEGMERHVKGIGDALTHSDAAEDDAIRGILESFRTELSGLSEDYRGSRKTFDEARGGLQTAITVTSPALAIPLSEQSYALAVNRYVSIKLREVFGLEPWSHDSADDFDDSYEELGDGEGGGATDPNEPNNTDGGYGKGDTIYGSNDLIYDPDSGKYIQYGELMTRYYAIMDEYAREGTLTPEQEAKARAYFELLLSGFQNG